MISRPKFCALGVAAAVLYALSGCGPSEKTAASNRLQPDEICTKRAYPEIGGGFTLVDQNGKQVSEADISKDVNLLFFGFTNCPDICPATLVRLKSAYALLPEDFAALQTIFVSVDPERDTPELLHTYLSLQAFPENTVGLTGSVEEIRAVAKAFFADYTQVALPDSSAGYTIDHTTLIYALDKDWNVQTFFTYNDSNQDIANCLSAVFG